LRRKINLKNQQLLIVLCVLSESANQPFKKQHQTTPSIKIHTMKKFLSFAMSLAILLAVPSMAMAKDKKKGKPAGDSVTSVDTTANTITVKGADGTDKTLKTDGATITINGVSGELAKITPGMNVKVTVGDAPDKATAIDATASSTGKKGKK
jgi:hypothetical protein